MASKNKTIIMKTNVYLGIILRIVALFTIAIAGTYIPEFLPKNFFGDYVDRGYQEWGIRHYWYFWMMVILCLLSMINCIASIVSLIKKHYDTSKWG